MRKKSTLSGNFQRVAGGGIAAVKRLGNGLLRAAERGKPLVVADGNRACNKSGAYAGMRNKGGSIRF